MVRRVRLQTDPMGWAQTMFGECKLADKRLTRRLVHTMAQLARQGGGSINRACAANPAARQGGYRLLRNTQVSISAMNEAGSAAAAQRIEPQHRILAIEDSSELSYSHAVAEELGDTGGQEGIAVSGLWARNTLMVDAENGMTLGLIAQTLWSRDKAEHGKKHVRRNKRPEEKESAK
jgi:Transposase DNA-binding